MLNKDRFGSITGKVVAVNGGCYQADPTQPGQLTLYFPGVAPGPAPYWIVQRTCYFLLFSFLARKLGRGWFSHVCP